MNRVLTTAGLVLMATMSGAAFAGERQRVNEEFQAAVNLETIQT